MVATSIRVLMVAVALAAAGGCSSNNNGSSTPGGGSRGNDQPGATPTPAATPTASPTPRPSVTPTPGGAPTPTPSAVPTTTPTPEPSTSPTPTPPPVVSVPTRYSFNNQCFALKSNASGQYVVSSGSGFAATGASSADAMRFFMKPAVLGSYLLYDTDRNVATAGATVGTATSAADDDTAVWEVRAVGDATEYPPAPAYDVEPTAAEVAAYRNFVDPMVPAEQVMFTASNGSVMAVGADDALVTAAAADDPAQSFTLEAVDGCADFPEAQSNVVGETFKGTTPDGRVLGMADVHVHISATTFLGHAQHGAPFHKLGVEHALNDCTETHGDGGSQDFVDAVFQTNFGGHNTDGWPTFSDWPGKDALTHEAIYWKWLERAWASGLRVAVNDLVENQTLCELVREAPPNVEPDLNCNPMDSAGRQAGTMYAMQDYIDAQYGGRGAGWFQIVHTPEEARARIEDGKLAVILGIEISNLFNCQIKYNSPLRLQEPWQETGEGFPEASYTCDDESIASDMDRIEGWGVRQIISIHEFDNAFGGNGIFNDFLNVGTRENSGANPAPDLTAEGVSALAMTYVGADGETPTGEFWTTYDCPLENETAGFSGYLWSGEGGSTLTSVDGNSGICQPTGQGGRYGGAAACYPAANQCNARWMTPIGLRTYERMMEHGFIFDVDHMELAIKTQALELAEAQPIAYPFVSTHGTFGGMSNDQAKRVLKNGGFLYPALNSPSNFRGKMDEVLGLYNEAFADVPSDQRPLFGFGFGTDTNGLSGQAGQEADIDVVYPYTLFSGALFDDMADFDGIAGVQFAQPSVTDETGEVRRTWDIDEDGSAHQGMLSGFVEEMRQSASTEQMQYLFNSAERYLRTWQRTLEASAAINAAGGIVEPEGVLRAAPTPGEAATFQ